MILEIAKNTCMEHETQNDKASVSIKTLSKHM